MIRLRFDLLKELTDQDILSEILTNNHRYKPEPLLSKTGRGSLSSASTKERAQEVKRCTALTRKLEKRARKSGKAHATTK